MKNNKIDNKSTVKFLIFILIAFSLIIIVARYTTDEEYRSFINTTILKKEVSETNVKAVEVNSDLNPTIFACDKYIAILSKNKLKEYDSDGKIVAELDMNIAVPLTESNGKYMVIAEKDGQRVYLVSGGSIIWSNTVDGNISRVSVNKNGYVSLVITNTIYKSVIVYYDTNGVEQFRYLSDSFAVCSSISTNNKYLAIGSVNYTGTIIKSYIKIISVELAQKNPKDAVVYTYESENDEIVTKINYQDKERVLCMFSSYIQCVTPTSDERFYDYVDDDLFIDVNLKNGIAKIDKQSSGLFSYEYEVDIKNLDTKSDGLYILNSDLPKSISVSGTNIALNLGNEVQIINSAGWMQKKYTSSKQIKNVVIGDSIAGIIYKNKIEIIDF